MGDTAKTVVVQVYMTQGQRQRLVQEADARDLSMSQYIRHKLFGGGATIVTEDDGEPG